MFNRFTVVSRIVTFPDGFSPGRDVSRKDVSRVIIFPERRFLDGHFPGKAITGCLMVVDARVVTFPEK